MEVLLNVWIEVESMEDAEEIVSDIHEILGKCGITNSVNIVDIENEGDDKI